MVVCAPFYYSLESNYFTKAEHISAYLVRIMCVSRLQNGCAVFQRHHVHTHAIMSTIQAMPRAPACMGVHCSSGIMCTNRP